MKRNNGAAPAGFQPGGTMARELRFAMADSYDAKARTVDGIFAAGSPVRRYGFVETLNMDPAAVDLSRVAAGQCKLLDSHNSYEIDAILGVVEEARIENGQLVGRIRFAETDAGRKAEGMVARGELTGFSIGYSIQRWINVSQEDTGLEEWRADQWTLLEVTLCAVPADPAATVRAVAANGPDSPASTATETQEEDMTRSAVAAAAPAAETPNSPQAPAAAPAPEQRAAAPAAPAPAPAPAPEAEQRAAAPGMTPAQTVALLQRADFFGERALAERMIGEGRDEAAIIAAVQAARAQSGANSASIGGPRAQIGQDETETRRRAMEDALSINLGEAGEANEPARRYMDNRYLFEFAADAVGHRGRLRDAAEREDVLRRAFHSTSDFPILLENALNRALRARYVVADPTYRNIATQRSYADFRPHIAVRDGDFPQMKEVKESGEIIGGTMGESKEQTSVKAYGVRVGFTRQVLVNDNLGAIQRVLNNRATAVARFEEETFYAMMLAASGAGPTLLETTRAVFNTTEGTLAGTAAAISNATLGIARQALRKMKTKDGTFLNISPAILLVGPDKETEAQGVLSPLYAAAAANVPLFAGSLRLVVSPQITGNAWYLFADPMVGTNFEWGLLEGYSAPRMRMDEPFGMQGLSVSLEHDFGVGAIDYRFGFRNAGA
jgi:HK97 family phage prohead protease